MNEHPKEVPTLHVEMEPEGIGPADIVAYSNTLAMSMHALTSWEAGSTIGYDFVTENVQKLIDVQVALAQYIVDVDS